MDKRHLIAAIVLAFIISVVAGPFARAQVMPPVWSNDCYSPWNTTVQGGSSITAYSNSAPAAACSTVSEARICNGGSLSGSLTLQTCTDGCTGTPWGSVATGYSNTAYNSATPAAACSTVSQTRTCTAGSLSGTFTATSCTDGCTGTPWGSVATGYSNTAYNSTTPAAACSTVSQTRTCTAGSLSGSFTATSCTDGCTGTPWGSVATGYSNTAYSTSAPTAACSTVSQTRTCTAGSLSGSYALTSCNDGCPSQGVAWNTNCTGTVGALAHGGNSSVTNVAGGYTGSVTETCTNGVLTQSAATCTSATPTGALYSWGAATNGQLGNGTTTPNTTSPGLVSGGFTDWTAVNTTIRGTYAIRNGLLYSWGGGLFGQLGIGSNGTFTTPQLVAGGFTDWTKLSKAKFNNLNYCAIRSTGILYCWGCQSYGMNGDGVNIAGGCGSYTTSPNVVSGGFTDWTAVASGNGLTCGVRGGLAYCWGANIQGGVGNGTNGATNVPNPSLVIGGITGWTDIAVNAQTACGIANGVAYCWGECQKSSGVDGGQCGNGQLQGRLTTPTVVSGGMTNWTKIGVSSNTNPYECGLAGGRAYCWGNAANGQLGNGVSTGVFATPQAVSGGITDFVDISVGIATCARRSNGNLYCWGINTAGTYGDGTTTTSNVPVLQSAGSKTTWQSFSTDNATCGF